MVKPEKDEKRNGKEAKENPRTKSTKKFVEMFVKK